ncbi:MAG: hypothetical protein CME59_22485 [Halioglobus sp.]|nr:hypothetical protein [Halioglobus sp.]|tara:strand:+ start:5 stop:451 length:447 start_codon:yes stop_codon:yes gene_type:complete
MIGALKALFETDSRREDSEAQRQRRIRLAAAALLIETARADFTQDAQEEQALEQLLSRALQLDTEEVHELVAAAQARVDESTSLYEFTRVINDHYSAQQKLQLIDAMWSVAYADGDLDKYEEHLIRQVAELTYVPHADYIRSKLAAAP